MVRKRHAGPNSYVWESSICSGHLVVNYAPCRLVLDFMWDCLDEQVRASAYFGSHCFIRRAIVRYYKNSIARINLRIWAFALKTLVFWGAGFNFTKFVLKVGGHNITACR